MRCTTNISNVLNVGVDFDNTLFDTSQSYCDIFQHYTGLHFKPADLIEYDTSKLVPPEFKALAKDLWNNELLYKHIQPLTDSQQYMKRLSDNSHIHIYIVSISDKHLMKTKIDLIEREYPFIHSNDVIFIHNKQLLNLDILVDDKFDNLLNAPYKGVLFTAPWNTSFNAEYNGLIRVNDWSECYDYIMNRLNSKTKIYKLYH